MGATRLPSGRDEPLTKEDGLKLLKKLKDKWPEKEAEKRRYGFEKGEEYVKEAAKNGGVDSSSKNQSFLTPSRRDIRADIAIKAESLL